MERRKGSADGVGEGIRSRGLVKWWEGRVERPCYDYCSCRSLPSRATLCGPCPLSLTLATASTWISPLPSLSSPSRPPPAAILSWAPHCLLDSLNFFTAPCHFPSFLWQWTTRHSAKPLPTSVLHAFRACLCSSPSCQLLLPSFLQPLEPPFSPWTQQTHATSVPAVLLSGTPSVYLPPHPYLVLVNSHLSLKA